MSIVTEFERKPGVVVVILFYAKLLLLQIHLERRYNMKKVLFFILLAGFLVGCSNPVEEPVCPSCEPVQVTKEVEVTREVEVIKEVEVTRLVEVIKEIEVIKEVEVTRQVEVIKEVEVANELGPWTVQQSITLLGQYLVPEEMQPGQWSYQADNAGDICWAKTYSDLSGSSASELGNFYSENKGFFVLNENVRMVKLQFGPCTWTRIGD